MSQSDRTLLITKSQYVHIINNNTGQIHLVEGPYQGSLEAHEGIYDEIQDKIVLKSNQYSLILNPVKEKILQEGEREIRKGPRIFSLYPGEIIEDGIRDAFSLADNQGIYIQNQKTGDVRLELGPKEVFLGVEEVLYEKYLTDKEREALNLEEEEFEEYMAVKIELDEREILQLVDHETIRYELGPKTVFLQPFEHPRVLTLSGSTPKRPDVITTAIIRLGPDFLSDILTIRTKDNAELKIHVRYKWRININPANLSQIFSIEDFIGFASETIASLLRGIAARHNFEDFHSNAAEIIKEVIFQDDKNLRVFENGFEIFSVDIKQITPVDQEIADKLNTAISASTDIYVKKQKQQAELDAQRQAIEGEKVIEEQRKGLIVLKNQNYQIEIIEKAKIEAETQIEKAKGLAKANIIRQEKIIQTDIVRIQNLIAALKEDSDNYLRYIELQAFKNADHSVIVPDDAKIWLPMRSYKKSEEFGYEDEE